VLERAHETFLTRADKQLAQSEEKSAERIRTLLAPVDQTLKVYKQQVEDLEAKRVDAFGQLTGQIEALRVGQEGVRLEALRLGNSLRNAPKARGRWGEQQLKNVLETCGLAEHTDFATEVSVAQEDGGRLRPDAIVRVPGGRALVIDAKVSLNAYQDAFGAVDDSERHIGLAAHAASMKAHINALGNKAFGASSRMRPIM
jgi:DNA recombination protein RmuC